jgi:hypothetical protein
MGRNQLGEKWMKIIKHCGNCVYFQCTIQIRKELDLLSPCLREMEVNGINLHYPQDRGCLKWELILHFPSTALNDDFENSYEAME